MDSSSTNFFNVFDLAILNVWPDSGSWVLATDICDAEINAIHETHDVRLVLKTFVDMIVLSKTARTSLEPTLTIVQNLTWI